MRLKSILVIISLIMVGCVGYFYGYTAGTVDGYYIGLNESNTTQEDIIKLSMMSGFSMGMIYQTYSNSFTEDYINKTLLNRSFTKNNDLAPGLIKCVESAKEGKQKINMYYAEPCYYFSTEVARRAIAEGLQ